MPDASFTASLPGDVFLSTYYKPSPVGVRSIAVVYDLIAETFPGLPNRADSAEIRRAVGGAQSVVSISHGTAQEVKRLLGRDSVVAYPGVAADFGKVAPGDVERFQAYIGKPYVLVVGRRGLYKNVQALYQAWHLWPGAKTHKVLCIGGEDSLPQDQAFAQRNDWQRLVLDDSDLRAAYAGATALVYPSLAEGFGLPIVEAMACGCPVVCDNSVVAEIAGEAGFYADCTRPKQIAGALDLTLDPALRIERTLNGIERAKMFTWGGMAKTLADVIRRTVQ